MKAKVFTAIGSNCIDEYYDLERIPLRGEKVEGIRQDPVVGGMIGNAASVLAGYGQIVYMIDYLSETSESELLLEALKNYRILPDAVEVSEKYTNNRCIIFRESSGERSIIIVNAKNQPFTLNPTQKMILEKSDYIYTTLTDLKRFQDPSLIFDCFQEGVTKLVYDVERPSIEGEQDWDLLIKASIIFMNEEAYDLVEEIFGFQKLCRYVPLVVVTRGEEGSEVFVEGKSYKFPARKVDVVDTTGAGDTYNTSFLYGYSQGWDIEKCGEFATTAASEMIRYSGPRSGVRTVSEILEIMDSNKL